MDWFEKLAGFQELDYAQTRRQFEVSNGKLHSHANGKSYGIGELELLPLTTLRERVHAGPSLAGRLKVSIVRGDVRAMHSAPENAGALFQVASQFNLLEMTSPKMTPEDAGSCMCNGRWGRHDLPELLCERRWARRSDAGSTIRRSGGYRGGAVFTVEFSP